MRGGFGSPGHRRSQSHGSRHSSGSPQPQPRASAVGRSVEERRRLFHSPDRPAHVSRSADFSRTMPAAARHVDSPVVAWVKPTVGRAGRAPGASAAAAAVKPASFLASNGRMSLTTPSQHASGVRGAGGCG